METWLFTFRVEGILQRRQSFRKRTLGGVKSKTLHAEKLKKKTCQGGHYVYQWIICKSIVHLKNLIPLKSSWYRY